MLLKVDVFRDGLEVVFPVLPETAILSQERHTVSQPPLDSGIPGPESTFELLHILRLSFRPAASRHAEKRFPDAEVPTHSSTHCEDIRRPPNRIRFRTRTRETAPAPEPVGKGVSPGELQM
jgi:hypothetical protein